MRALLPALALALALASPVGASDAPGITVTLKNHRFTPAEISVPAGQRVRINLVNQDPATEEFDSHDLRIEQVVTPMGRASFFIGPLSPGQYSFMGEFHADTAQGKVTALAGAR